MNVNNINSSLYIVKNSIYHAVFSFPREVSLKNECESYELRIYKLPYQSWFVCPQDTNHLQSINNINHENADNKTIID